MTMRPVTADNTAPLIAIVACLLLILATLAVLSRLGMKYWIARRLDLDDWMICVALLFSIAHTICVSIAASHGYGNPITTLTADQLQLIQKTTYAANLMLIGTLCFSKLCTAFFIYLLRGYADKREVSLLVSIAIWSLSSFLVMAFQCHAPQTWNAMSNKCINLPAWWNYFGVMNIITEVVLIIWPTVLVCKVQMGTRKKIIAITCFAIRIPIIGAIICELFFRNTKTKTQGPSNPFLNTWPVSLCVETLLFFAILAPCAPQLKPVMESLQSTGLRLYQLPGEHGPRTPYVFSNQTSRSTAEHALTGLSKGSGNKTIVSSRRDRGWDEHSQTSQSRIIRQTTTWAVEEQHQSELDTEH